MPKANQTPEQAARDIIDGMLEQAGWKVQSKDRIDFGAGLGIAVREYQTDVGPADYVLFVNKKAVGVIEAKPENWGQNITKVEAQSGGYAAAKLKWLNNQEPLPFVYESTGVLTRFHGYARSEAPVPRDIQIPSAEYTATVGRSAGLPPNTLPEAICPGSRGTPEMPI